MKIIYRIAKTELYTLFYSPIAWFVLLIFSFQVGIAFTSIFEYLVIDQTLERGLWNITDKLFAENNGIYRQVRNYLYLYLPLLTMGLMSKEYNSGSFKLLYSSPIKNSEIIFGKFLAVVIYALLMMGVLGLFVLFSFLTVKDFELLHALSGLVGLFLLTCAYGAIGLFMSCLTSYQVAAALCTIAVLTLLGFIGIVGQEIPFLREITYWLSINGRTDDMIKGLISSEDIIYFLVVIGIFIQLSILKLKSQRAKIKISKLFVKCSLILSVSILIGFVSSCPRFVCYYDTTSIKKQTLTPVSQDVIKNLDGKVTITSYVNFLDENYRLASFEKRLNDQRFIRDYIRFKPDIKMKYVYYYDKVENESLDQRFPGLDEKEKAEKLAEGLKLNIKKFLTPEQIRAQIDLSVEGNRFVRLFEKDSGERAFLRLYKDMPPQPFESEITAVFKKLSGQAINVGFSYGHGERDIERKGDKDYYKMSVDKTFRYSLVNNGFNVFKINLKEENELINKIDILYIVDAKRPFQPEELEKIYQYIEQGGNLIIACEPEGQNYMNPIAEQLGIQFVSGRLYQKNKDYEPSLILGKVSEEGAQQSSKLNWMRRWNYVLTMPDAVGLEMIDDKGFEVKTLLETDSILCWNLEMNINNKPIPIVKELRRNIKEKEQRIIVMGDADCFSNSEIKMNRNDINTENHNYFVEMMHWITNGELPVKTVRPRSPDFALHIHFESIIWMKILFLAFIPLLISVSGITIRLKRKRK